MRYTTEQAAAILGVSARTLYRKIRAGEILTEKDERDRRRRWVILEEVADEGRQTAGTLAGDLAVFAEMLDKKDDEIRGLHKEMGDLIARHGAAMERIRLLEAPRGRRPSLAERIRGALFGGH